jgi:uncharacterized phage protein gp47/JayE
MSYVPRNYEVIVRDMLTTLTGGTVREIVTASAGDTPIILEKLQNRPVRRISHLEGKISVGVGMNAREVPYKFTPADFELISITNDENNKDSIRFRDGGRRPIPGSQLTVNYYPIQTDPTPLTDLNVGSVIRTLTETVAREMAMAYLQLEHIYKSAYLETAEGSALEKVVALVGVQRLPTGFPVVRLRFTRRADTATQVTIPANTAVTDAAGNRYLTLDTLTLEPGETTREVTARGETPGTKLVEAEALKNRMEVLIAGVAEVTNPQPARTLNAPETDDALRRRAAASLHGVVRGTLDALRFGLLSINGVKNVNIIEAPNGVPGEIRIEVAHAADDPDLEATISRTIEDIRPAGIRVLWNQASNKRLSVRVSLTLTGTGGELAALNSGVEARLKPYLSDLPPGGKARRSQMLKLVLEDPRVTDAEVKLLPDSEGEMDELALPSNTILEVVGFTFPAPTFEQAGAAPAIVSTVSALLPIHLVEGITLAQATNAIQVALEAFLTSRAPDQPLDVDRMAAAIRDDSRFALVRAEVIVTVESGGRFLQLTDGVGIYNPAPNERFQKGEITIEPREGML